MVKIGKAHTTLVLSVPRGTMRIPACFCRVWRWSRVGSPTGMSGKKRKIRRCWCSTSCQTWRFSDMRRAHARLFDDLVERVAIGTIMW